MVVIQEHNIEMWEKDPNGRVLNVSVVGRKVFLSMGKIVVGIYVAQVCFGIRVWMRVRDSAIFEKGGCGCGGTRRLKNLIKIILFIFYIYFYY